MESIIPETTINDQKSITVDIPLTTTSGKIRIKNRSSFYEYGLPVATRQNNFLQSNYVEWQIGYDTTLDDAEKMAETTLGTKRFTAYNHREKAKFIFDKHNYRIIPEMIRIFGMLSESHRFDTLAILKLIHEDIFS